VGSLRRLLKSGVEEVLAGSLARSLGRKRRRGQRLILAYHNVVAKATAPPGDRSLHLGLDDLRKQLDELTRWGVVGDLTRVLSDSTDEPLAAITFDDAYAGAVNLAVPELKSRGLPATVFVAPGLLGQPLTWWDILALRPGGMSEATREFCLTGLAGDQSQVLKWAAEDNPGWPAPGGERIASVTELSRAAEWDGLTLGAHSYNHPNLTRVSDARLTFEVEASLHWLRQNFPGRSRPWLAYPYGLFDDRVAAAAAAAGYQATFAIRGGWWHSGHRSAIAVPRLNIPAGMSANGFGARLNGLVDF
jgi:peptidoglycan/xylan/chitin deacetylase (PgdA/CDA1 family)